ncbi:hypothetical protein ILYODFUR_035536 [Ilyodon furcidens]|uniref:Uncharacterized protein n=1 Tax=Ilyodon furcidens TaxID=33524 RepID=A0ABV0UYY1_9TELE
MGKTFFESALGITLQKANHRLVLSAHVFVWSQTVLSLIWVKTTRIRIQRKSLSSGWQEWKTERNDINTHNVSPNNCVGGSDQEAQQMINVLLKSGALTADVSLASQLQKGISFRGLFLHRNREKYSVVFYHHIVAHSNIKLSESNQ